MRCWINKGDGEKQEKKILREIGRTRRMKKCREMKRNWNNMGDEEK